MDQREFESNLEFRLCREFAGMSRDRLSELWCDGVLIGGFLLNDVPPRLLGSAWICRGDEQEEWNVELLLPRTFASREEIPWAELLPAEDVTRWLSVDQSKKLLQIEPGAAMPDGA